MGRAACGPHSERLCTPGIRRTIADTAGPPLHGDLEALRLMFGSMFVERTPIEYRGWAETEHELDGTVAWNMIAPGATLEPDSRELRCMCEADGGEGVAHTCDTFGSSLRAVRGVPVGTA